MSAISTAQSAICSAPSDTTVSPGAGFPSTFQKLKQFIISATGLAYYENQDDELSRKIEVRLNELRLSSWEEYLELLRRDVGAAEELAKLTNELTIGVTHFFRHQEAFDALKNTVLPDLIHRNRTQRRLRI